MARVFVVMGVSSCGKSSVGEALAKRLEADFVDGDDLHPQSNVDKMRAGNALNDSDRLPWLREIQTLASSYKTKITDLVVVCSALKLSYRELLRHENPHLYFLFLQGSFELIAARMQRRQQHFMPLALLQSQFDALETPHINEPNLRAISIEQPFAAVVQQALSISQGCVYEPPN